MQEYKQGIIKLQHCRKVSAGWDGSHRNMNGWVMWLQKRKLPLWAVLTSAFYKDTIDSYFVLLSTDEASAGALAWFHIEIGGGMWVTQHQEGQAEEEIWK